MPQIHETAYPRIKPDLSPGNWRRPTPSRARSWILSSSLRERPRPGSGWRSFWKGYPESGVGSGSLGLCSYHFQRMDFGVGRL